MDTGLFQNRRGRLVAGHRRAGNRGPRENILVDQQSRHRQRRALRQSLSADATTSAVYARPAQRCGPEARLHPFPLGLRGHPAQRRDGMVRRCRIRLAQLQAPDSRRAEFRAFRHSLLDHRHRRLHSSAIPTTRLIANCSCAGLSTAPSARFSACTARAPPTQNELWSYGPEAQKILDQLRPLRYRLMPYIYSLAWKITQRELHSDAAAGDGLSRRRRARKISAISSCSARRSW